MDENKKLSEEQLDGVAGGVGASWACWFTPSGKKKQDTVNGVTVHLAECASHCFGGFDQCGCHGEKHCKSRWHVIQEDGFLSPIDFKNHYNKFPPDYSAC